MHRLRLAWWAFLALASLAAPSTVMSATFSASFNTIGFSNSDVPGQTSLTLGSPTAITVATPTQLAVYKMRQTTTFSFPGWTNPRLQIGTSYFDVSPQPFSNAGTFLGVITYSGNILNDLSLTFYDPAAMIDVTNFGVGFYDFPGNATWSGIGPFIGDAYGLYWIEPTTGGIYRFNAYAPEPAAWMLMILGVGATGGIVRHRRSLPA